jgi:hypothetical protein
MQGEVWSPNGEARELILSKGLEHTSMTVGDVIRSHQTGEHWMVGQFGFEPILADEPGRLATGQVHVLRLRHTLS